MIHMALRIPSAERRLRLQAVGRKPIPLYLWVDQFVDLKITDIEGITYDQLLDLIKRRAKHNDPNARGLWAAYTADKLRGLVR